MVSNNDTVYLMNKYFTPPVSEEEILSNVCNYSDISFWDARYCSQDENPFFEWYLTFHDLELILNANIKTKTESILMIGCGNSDLSFEMNETGYTNVLNIDFSRVVIYQMKHKYPKLQWAQMNALYMSYPDKTFQVVIDKGTLDCIFCHRKEDDASKQVKKYCNEIERVLKDGGLWIVISNAGPELRLEYLENEDSSDSNFMTFDCICVYHEYSDFEDNNPNKQEDNGYYIYVCKKDPEKSKRKDDIFQKKKKALDRMVFKQTSKADGLLAKHKRR